MALWIYSMERFPHKMNLQQLAERSGFSADKVDLLIQEGLVSPPSNGYSFTNKHLQELENIKQVTATGYSIECGRQCSYVVDEFTLG